MRVLIGLVCTVLATTAGAGEFSLRDSMTAEEFHEAGLAALSEQQLDELEAWIQTRLIGDADVPKASVAPAAIAAPAVAAPVLTTPAPAPVVVPVPTVDSSAPAPPAPAAPPAPVAPTTPEVPEPVVVASTETVAANDDLFGKEDELELTLPERITSYIDGEFTGYERGAIFKLENGQVWEQAESKEWDHNASHPAVEIYRRSLGSYRLKLAAYNRSVRVRRIK